MKLKWLLPFAPMGSFAYPASPDPYARVFVAVATLMLVAVLLVIIQPWREDGRRG